MAEAYKSYRIRTKVGQDAPNVVNVHLDQTYDEFQILSLKIEQKNSYNLYQSDKGIIVGRVLANGGFGVPNAKVSVFIPSDETMGIKKHILYPYSSVNDTNSDRVRYNLLPDSIDELCHQNVGTFPNKRYVLDNDDIVEIFDKFWKYTTVTNNSGDYMLYGIPVGNQTLHMDVDLSDIGLLSQRPRDLVYKGFNINLFESPNKFKQDANLNSLAQIKSQDIGVYVYPFWGDSTDNPDNIAVTRCDIQVDYKFEPTCIFMGSIITDTGSNAIGKNCAGTDNVGKMSDLVSGEGSIEMIRKTIDNKVEEFQIKGNRVIDGDGVWCYQIPMNLDYVMTDEFGNLVPTDNPDKGIPTRTRVRFRISLDSAPSDNTARNRCRYLVPNNPRIDNDRFPIFTNSVTKEPDYEFGMNTREESYCDLFWNKVYTVKNYIPRIQKNNRITNRQHTGIKLINHYGDNNPMPYNSLSIKLTFTYRFICVLTNVFIMLVGFLNNLITIIGALPCKLKEFFNKIAKIFKKIPLFGKLIAAPFVALAKVFDILTPPCIAISNEFCTGSVTHNNTYYPGCGCKGIAAVLKPIKLCDCVWKKTRKQHDSNNSKLSAEDRTSASNNDSELKNCVESELAESNDAPSFNFQNDWVNGVLYAPLWYRKITKKRSFLFGLIKKKAKDEWCSADHVYNGLVRIFHPCAVTRNGSQNYTSHDGKENTAKYMTGGGCNNNCQNNRTTVGLNNGLIRTKKTMLGQTVYYYKPIEFEFNSKDYKTDGNSNGTLKLLFATDIVLLGSLNDCDLNGVPQFFKSLESTTYKLPSNMLLTDNVIEQKMNPDGTLSPYYEQTSTTEMTGNDWGNTNQDLCGKPDGGLFYSIGCSDIDMMPKSCINLSRICEFGVSLDETKWVPNISSVETQGDNAFDILVPDGFISKDELYNDNERSMFATLNGNELITKLNTSNGLKEYDFRHLYLDNFDKSLYQVMSNRQRGCKGKTYQYNYNLEGFSPGYYDFRMGKNPYYYDDNGTLPRYENSFYFYFGLKVGKTAIDKFNTQFFSECYNSADAVSPVSIDVMANSWCSDDDKGNMDGFVKLDLTNVSLPCDIIIKDENDVSNEFILPDINDEKIILADNNDIINDAKKNGYVKVKNENGKIQGMIPNGYYTLTITDNDGEIIESDFELLYPKLRYTVETTNFKQPDNVLMEKYNNNRVKIAMEYEGVNDENNPSTRPIGGTIAISNIVDGYGKPITNWFIEIKSVNIIKNYRPDDNNPDEDKNFELKLSSDKLDNSFWLNKDKKDDEPYIFGVPKGDEQYIITVAELCTCGDSLCESNNRYVQTVMINNPTPYKLYINDTIDYDVIKGWSTGFKVTSEESSNNVVEISNYTQSTFNDNWLNMSDETRYNWRELISYKKNVEIINDAIETANGIHNDDSGYDPLPIVKIGDDVNLTDDELENYITNINNYKNSEKYDINIEQQCDTIIEACEEIKTIKDEFISDMKSTFWLTCQDEVKTITLTAITDDMPVGFHVAYRQEKNDEDGDFNILEEYKDNKLYYSFNEVQEIDNITIPSLTTNDSIRFGGGTSITDGSNITIALDNNSGYDTTDKKTRYPFFIGVTNSSETKDDGIPNGETIPQKIKESLSNLFGFHIIDKIMDINFIVWSAMVGIPYYKPIKEKNGKSVTMNGLFAAKMRNGVTQDGEFETAKVGNDNMKIETVNDEDEMPTNRYVVGVQGDNNNLITYDFTDYSIKQDSVGDDNTEYIPLRPKTVNLELEDKSGCSINDSIYGGLRITLGNNSINDLTNKKSSLLNVSCLNGPGEKVTYFLYKLDNEKLYPLNYVNDNKMTEKINIDTIYSKGSEYGLFSYGMDLQELINKATTDATTILYEDNDENETGLKSVGIKEYFKLNGNDKGYENNSIGSTGIFLNNDGSLSGPYFVVARTENECRAISPVYDFVEDIHGGFDLVKMESLFEVENDDTELIIENKIGIYISNESDLYYFSNFAYSLELTCNIDSQNQINGNGTITQSTSVIGGKKMVFININDTEYGLLASYFKSGIPALVDKKNTLIKKTTMVATDVTGLKHKFRPSKGNMNKSYYYLITFNLNGNGSFKDDVEPSSYVKKGDYYELLTVVNDGDYRFKGWSTDKGGNGEISNPGDIKQASNSVIWYAIWVRDYTVRWIDDTI